MTAEKKKTKRSRLSRLFHPDTSSPRDDKKIISISSLRKMASTQQQKDILKRIENETIPIVRDAWIDYFFEITKRSSCKSN